jgi:hypothetical protein
MWIPFGGLTPATTKTFIVKVGTIALPLKLRYRGAQKKIDKNLKKSGSPPKNDCKSV